MGTNLGDDYIRSFFFCGIDRKKVTATRLLQDRTGMFSRLQDCWKTTTMRRSKRSYSCFKPHWAKVSLSSSDILLYLNVGESHIKRIPAMGVPHLKEIKK